MTNVEIRERTVEDTQEFCRFLNTLDNEAEYMLYEKGERVLDPDIVRNNIQSIINNKDACYVALINGSIIGFIIAVREKFIRTKHSAVIVVGILEKYCGRGIGSELFHQVFLWASENDIKRLELTVVSNNKRALSLYNKLGFKLEGTKEMSILIGKKYCNEYLMGKLLF